MLVFAATIFLSAFLLFQVQPLIAKFILPWFGGAPNVWTTCMMFFQLVLLGGYLYADLLSRYVKPKAQAVIHGVCLLVSLAFLPIIPADVWRPEGTESPTIRILTLLLASIGLPYFMLSTTGPLVQAWFGRRYEGRSPYRLFALSNLGSMLALLTFPFLFEPMLPTRGHAWAWGIGYGAFVGLCLLTMYLSLKVVPQYSGTVLENTQSGNSTSQERVTTWRTWLWWLGLALVPSVLLLATTNHICQDVAVVPLLWIAPLSLYLLSFIICFDKPVWYRRELWGGMLAISTVLTVFCLYHGRPFGMLGTTSVFLAMLFSAAMVCHGELTLLCPGLRLLTAYYLMISLGGALGGVFVVLVAPQIFVGFYELHLALGLAVFLGLGRIAADADWHRLFQIVAVGTLAGAVIGFWSLFDTNRDLQGHMLSRFGVSVALGLWALMILSFSSSRIFAIQGVGDGNEIGRPKWFTFVGSILFSTWLAGTIFLVWKPKLVLDYLALLSVFWGLGVIFAAFLGRGQWISLSARPRLSAFGAVMMSVVLGGFLLENATKNEPQIVHRSRDFYGLLAIKREVNSLDGESLHMFNGKVFHGFQFTRPDLRMRKTAYYGERSGIGIALSQHPKRQQNLPLKVAVIGLGTGSLAAWAQPGDTYVFYEINAKCVELAETDFFYLSDNPASDQTLVHTGDGRILLERQAKSGDLQNFDVLIVDAFTGAGIPQHLVTHECFELYRQHLQPDGILAFHISNAYLDLRPVIHHQGERMNWETRVFDFSPSQQGIATARFEDASLWLLLSQNQDFWDTPDVQRSGEKWESGWRVEWTDDFGGIWQVFKFQTPDWWKTFRSYFAG